MGFDLPPAPAGEHVTPPLQPDLAGHRLAHDFAHARDLHVEGIEGKQRIAPFTRSEQSGQETVPVSRADQRLAMGE